MSRFLNFILIATLSLTASMLTSCMEGNYRGDAMFVLYVEDSPATDVESLLIEIDKVEISTDGTNWVNINIERKSFDIIQYVGGLNLNVARQTVPNGSYKKMRITFLDNITLSTFELPPSTTLDANKAVQEFDINFNAQKDMQHIEMIDIDVPQSLIKTDENNYIFAPNLTLIDINQGVVKAILVTKGSSDHALDTRMLVSATRSDGYNRQTYTTKMGGNLFIRLKEGVYTIDILPMSNDKENQPTKIENVEVTYKTITNLEAIYIDNVEIAPEQ